MAPLTIIPQKPKWGSSLMGVVPDMHVPLCMGTLHRVEDNSVMLSFFIRDIV